MGSTFELEESYVLRVEGLSVALLGCKLSLWPFWPFDEAILCIANFLVRVLGY